VVFFFDVNADGMVYIPLFVSVRNVSLVHLTHVFFFDVNADGMVYIPVFVSVRNVSLIHLTHFSPYIDSAFAFTELSAGLCLKLLLSFYFQSQRCD
jgi:hypothetical protein